ncbi:hypothetical protein ACFQ9X_41915 [Catenulispora yoronensis]
MSSARLLLRRAAAQRTLLAAVVAVLLPALVLVTLIGLHASAVRAAAVRSALKTMAPDERTVRVVYGSGTEWQATPDQRTAFFAELHRQVDAAFVGVGARIATTVVSGPYVLEGGGTDAVAFWSGDGLRDEARLVQGAWPEPGPGDGDFPALVSRQSLDAHHWKLGDLVATRSGWEHDSVLRFRIAGVYEPVDPADRFWQHDGDQAPVLVDAAVTGRAGTVLSRATVTAEPDPAGFPAGRIPRFDRQLAAFDAWVPGSSTADDFAASLDDRLAPRIADLVGVTTVSLRLEWLVAAELGVLTAAAMALIARALADRRHAGDGLLRARGSSISALTRVHVVEGLLLALPCAVLAPGSRPGRSATSARPGRTATRAPPGWAPTPTGSSPRSGSSPASADCWPPGCSAGSASARRCPTPRWRASAAARRSGRSCNAPRSTWSSWRSRWPRCGSCSRPGATPPGPGLCPGRRWWPRRCCCSPARWPCSGSCRSSPPRPAGWPRTAGAPWPRWSAGVWAGPCAARRCRWRCSSWRSRSGCRPVCCSPPSSGRPPTRPGTPSGPRCGPRG